jgi:hypothetical protein
MWMHDVDGAHETWRRIPHRASSVTEGWVSQLQSGKDIIDPPRRLKTMVPEKILFEERKPMGVEV